MSLGGYKGTRLTPGKKEKRHFVFIGFFQQRWRKFSSMRSALAFTGEVAALLAVCRDIASIQQYLAPSSRSGSGDSHAGW
jgi:hypothetical protein